MLSFACLKIGAPADCGITWTLPRSVGLRRATGITFGDSAIPAERNLAWGLVNRLVPQNALQE